MDVDLVATIAEVKKVKVDCTDIVNSLEKLLQFTDTQITNGVVYCWEYDYHQATYMWEAKGNASAKEIELYNAWQIIKQELLKEGNK